MAGKSRNRGGIKNIAPLHRGGHVQVVLDQEVHFAFFFRVELQSVRGRFQSQQAAGHMVFHRHSFAHVVQKQGKNQQVAPLHSSPQWSEMRAACVNGRHQLLQMFNGPQRMLVHRVAVIKIAHHQRINRPKFRQDFRQQTQPVHRPQRE